MLYIGGVYYFIADRWAPPPSFVLRTSLLTSPNPAARLWAREVNNSKMLGRVGCGGEKNS